MSGSTHKDILINCMYRQIPKSPSLYISLFDPIDCTISLKKYLIFYLF